MTDDVSTRPHVAVVGAGAIGRGWATLVTAAGWPVSLFDINAKIRAEASAEIEERAHTLVKLGRATPERLSEGLSALTSGRSLLHAVRDAHWVIEAVHEDLATKQRVVESIDTAAPVEAIISSSSSGLPPADIAARSRHQERILVAHPMDPPEIIPLVEVVPGTHTSKEALRAVWQWLRDLDRIPVMLHKSAPGYVVGRIAAAVWRESIDLVLNGVIDLDELDRAVSLGPGLGWAAAGPHLSYHLAASDGGVRFFLQNLLTSFETWWGDLASWTKLEPEQQRQLVSAIEKTYQRQLPELRAARDRRLAGMLQALERARRDSESRES